MIEIVVIVSILCIIALFLIWNYFRESSPGIKKSSPPFDQTDGFSQRHTDERENTFFEDTTTDFQRIVQKIEHQFQPSSVQNEEQAEQQLTQFLGKHFPNIVQRKGHTSRGVKIDLVIEGSYALELIVAHSEGRLLTLMDQMVKSTSDFGKIAVIIIHSNDISERTIDEYIQELTKMEITTIVKKV